MAAMSETSVPSRGASHYAKGTAANMARSMVVIAAITLFVFFVVGRTSSVTPATVDVPGAAQQHATQAQQPFAYPTDLPEGWTATSVRYVRSKGDLLMWNAGYTTPDGQYVSVQQAVDAPQDWINTQTNNGARTGTWTDADGTEWLRRDREGKVQRSLVDDPSGTGELTTLVTGTGSWSQLELFADHLTAVDPAACSAPSSS